MSSSRMKLPSRTRETADSADAERPLFRYPPILVYYLSRRSGYEHAGYYYGTTGHLELR
jgi:hypothetical protein